MKIKAFNETVATESNPKAELYKMTIGNIRTVGNKKYAYVPIKLLMVDADIQRAEDSSNTKINNLMKDFNPLMMDALRVSPHEENYEFSIIDGYHRYMAAKGLGIEMLEVEILDVSIDPMERKIEEATIFATQNDRQERLTTSQKHKANVIRGIRENVLLQNILDDEKFKGKLSIKRNSGRGYGKIWEITAVDTALNILKKGDQKSLEEVLEVLVDAGWNITKGGLGRMPMMSVYLVLNSHPQYKKEISEIMSKYLRNTTPTRLNIDASDIERGYPYREKVERNALFLEDMVCDNLNIERKYLINGDIQRKPGVKIA